MKGSVFYLRIIILLTCLISIVSRLEESKEAFAFLVLLIFALNMQLRVIYFKESLFVLSLLGDLFLSYYIYDFVGGIVYVLVYITLIDSIVYAEKYKAALILVCGFVLAINVGTKGYDTVLINIILFLVVVGLTSTYTTMKRRNENLEYLYDDIRKYSYELENAKKQIESYSEQVENIALIKERQRISEEIHDTIGHRLTALLMQLEAGVRLMEVDEQQAKQFLGMSVDNLRESIDVLRQTVRSMKPKGYKNIIYSFEEMIRKFKRETGTNVELKIDGTAVRLYPGVEMVLFKNAQEAITNAARHGKAKNVHILLSYKVNSIELIVKDDGVGSIDITKGMGISSMEERLKFVGGSLEIINTDGFTIKSIIPISETLEDNRG